MQKLTTIQEAFKFIRAAEKAAKERKKKAEQNDYTTEVAYNLLKADNFDDKDYISYSEDLPRARMPQIPKEEIDSIIIHFGNKHGGLRKTSCPIKKLMPTQNEIDMDKVRKFIRKNDHNWKERRYIVSKDFKLADGHHDIVTGLIEDPDSEVTIYKSRLPIRKLIEVLNKMKVSNREDIKGSKV